MDSSTSTLFDPAHYVLNGYRASVDNLSPQDWAYIIEVVIGRLKPNLQYMDGFRRLEQPTDIWPRHRLLHGSASFTLAVPERVLWRSIADLTWLVSTSEGSYPWKTLLLEKSGKWVVAGYLRRSSEPAPYWKYVSDADLLELLADTSAARPGQIGSLILDGLLEMVRTTIRRQEERLEANRNREKWLTAILNRTELR